MPIEPSYGEREMDVASAKCPPTTDKSTDFHRQRFAREAYRLFTSDTSCVESLRVLTDSVDLERWVALQGESIEDLVEANRTEATEAFYIIRQKTSFSRLLVTQEDFQVVLNGHNVFTQFSDVVTAFGFKRDEDHRTWDGYHALISSGPGGCPISEFCYNVRYVERHNRESTRPWSLRQTGIYQQLEMQSQKSTWVLLQPSASLFESLQDILRNKASDLHGPDACPMALHLHFLTLMASNWGEYIEYLWAESTALDDKACHSTLGFEKPHDYSVEFADCQKLQRLRRTLLRTLSALDSCLALADGAKSHCRKLDALQITATGSDKFFASLEIYKSQITQHHRNVSSMIEYLRGTADMLSNILESRRDDIMVKTNQAMQANLDLMSCMTAQGQKDSMILKILSIVATVYLPATLLATIFSSNLVQFRTDGADSGGNNGHYVVVSEFWLYVVMTLSLTAITMIPAVVMLKRRRNKPRLNNALV